MIIPEVWTLLWREWGADSECWWVVDGRTDGRTDRGMGEWPLPSQKHEASVEKTGSSEGGVETRGRKDWKQAGAGGTSPRHPGPGQEPSPGTGKPPMGHPPTSPQTQSLHIRWQSLQCSHDAGSRGPHVQEVCAKGTCVLNTCAPPTPRLKTV